MTEWYFADGQERQGPLSAEEMRQRFQRGDITLTTLVWREGFAQWAPLSEAVDELQLQNLASAASTVGSGIDLRGDYTAIDNGTAPLPGTGGGTYSPYTAPAAATGYANTAVVSGQDVVYAGFWKRYAAYFIDYILLTVVTLPLSMIINVMGVSSGSEGMQVALTLVVMLLSMVISIGYYAGFHASRGGATLGKMAVGIKVVRGTGERISFLRAFCRYLATIVSSLILMIGFIMAAFTERKQALHDMMCDTLVVDKWAFTDHPELQQRGLGTVTIVILVIAALAVVALFGVMIAMIGVIASMS
ncbi:RDD family protein [Stenotrophomonas rhizophila]|uniref:RDD family membrane protein YckC n=1 Tax=Stenotrophomonas rhizophila TaxID=216778 RepID=A0AAW5PD31_9GAMM|nr:RDD family protein [Stenotrophomonas rhizophila]MCS4278210.1 putative RDD family membrane protein YckC [Stenotrophomonas rhizophila]